MPGREREYEAYQRAMGGGVGGAYTPPPGSAYAPPPIDEERLSRSPGLQNNFYDLPTADFKRPHGMRGAMPPQTASVGGGFPGAPAAQPAGRGESGAETPLPWRENEAYQGQGMGGAAYQGGGGWGGGGGGAVVAPPGIEVQLANGGSNGGPGSAPQPLVAVGDETPMPGRERQYAVFKAQGGGFDAGGGGTSNFVPPPIDEERRSRSPGLQRNFYDISAADFKRPYGMTGEAAPPPPPEALGPSSPSWGPGGGPTPTSGGGRAGG